jgi:hypothetical protein
MSFRIQEHIVWLQISMNDALRMDILQGTTKLGHPEPHRLFRETFPRDVKSEITAIHKINHDISIL